MGRNILNIEESSPSQSNIYGSLINYIQNSKWRYPSPLYISSFYFGGAGLIGVDEDELS